MLRTRILTALVAIPLALATVYVGGWLLAGAVAALSVLAALELRALATAAGIRWLCPLSVAAAPAVVLAARLSPDAQLYVLAASTLLILGWALLVDLPPAGLGAGAGLSVAIPLYAGLLPACLVRLRDLPDAGGIVIGGLPLATGLAWTLFALLTTWACDSFAFFGGRALGRRPFFPRLSPRKTTEGAIAGLVGAGAVGLACAGALGVGPAFGFAAGLLCGVAAEAGDLPESLLKRAAGVKDSGGLFPGHGGVLDRIDSLLFVGVVALLAFQLAKVMA